MKHFLTSVAICCLALAAAKASGQNTTVQQPTFNFNTVTTTVTAPDGGTVLLGGVKRASSGRTERGVPILNKLPFANRLFKNVGIGQDYSTGMTSVTPRIIILEEEEAKLGLPDYSSGAAVGGAFAGSATRNYGQAPRQLSEDDVKALRLSQHVATNASLPVQSQPQPAGPTAEEIQSRNELAVQKRLSEADSFFAKGQAAETAGKANVAKIYYQMALRRAGDELRDQIQQRLDAVTGQ